MYLYRKRKAAGSQVGVLLAKARRSTSIYNRRYRLTVRKELLQSIILAEQSGSEDISNGQVTQWAERLVEALNDPKPLPHTQTTKILVRYSFLVADYFQPERIAPLQPALLARLSSSGVTEDLWTDTLQPEILKSYDRWVKVAALSFILELKKVVQSPIDSLRNSGILVLDTTERHRPMLAVQRAIGKKLKIQHFYGRKFLSLWYKFIRYFFKLFCVSAV